TGRQFFPFFRPLQEVPSNPFFDGESRLPTSVNLDCGGAGLMPDVLLHIRGADPQPFHHPACFAPPIIASDAASDYALVPQNIGHVGKVGRRTAQNFSRWKKVPQDFTYPDHHRRLSHETVPASSDK